MKIKFKYLWIKVLIPVLLVLVPGLFAMAPEKWEFKTVQVVAEIPADYHSKNSIMIASNRIYVEGEEGLKPLGNEVDVEGPLKFGLAVESDKVFEFAYREDLNSLMELMDNDNLIVYVHGDGKTLEKTLWRASLMVDAYDADVLVFSWPTRNPEMNGYENFKNSSENAELSKEQLAAFFKMLDGIEGIREKHVTALFHSLGNRLLELSIGTGRLNEIEEPLFDNLVLNAAAVDADKHQTWVSKLNIQHEIYVVSSKYDVNLRGAKIFTPLGHTLGLEPKGELLKSVKYIDMSEAMGFSFKRSASHSYFVGDGIQSNKNVHFFYRSVFEHDTSRMTAIGNYDEKSGKIIINKDVSG